MEATRRTKASSIATSASTLDFLHRLVVDHSERQSALVDAVRRSGWFDVQMDRLATGDYLVSAEVLVERKTIRDLAAPFIHGRLFPQVARLAQSPYRSLLLIEGPAPPLLPDVHPHSVEGALVHRNDVANPGAACVRTRTVCTHAPVPPRR
jgi:ERCC4-type nuclease